MNDAESNVFIIDNGAGTAKLGYMTDEMPRCVPNCIMKTKYAKRFFIGDEIKDCINPSGIYYTRPFDKGYVVNWDTQINIWDYMFGRDCCNVNLEDRKIIVTEPFFNFIDCQRAMNEIFFEHYQCGSLLRINAGDLSCYKYYKKHENALCCLLVDAGFSFTHIVPYLQGKREKLAIQRINVGGKLLTNQLKEIISYRHLNVMENTHIVNKIKEDVCYVSTNLMHDMEIARKTGPENTICRQYVLPDYVNVHNGFVLDPTNPPHVTSPNEQILHLSNERFSIPEILFCPSDIDIQQCGVAEAIVNAVKKCPPITHSHLYKNILVVGGSAQFPGFKRRLKKELRPLVEDIYELKIRIPSSPIAYAWQGGASLCAADEFNGKALSKQEYEEEGDAASFRRFDI